jgi:hypothetical protein
MTMPKITLQMIEGVEGRIWQASVRYTADVTITRWGQQVSDALRKLSQAIWMIEQQEPLNGKEKG